MAKELNGVEDVRLRCAVRAGKSVEMEASGSFVVREGLLETPWLVRARGAGAQMLRVCSEEDLEAVRERRLAFPRPNMHVLLSEALRGDMEVFLELKDEAVARVVLLPTPARWWRRLGEAIWLK